MDASRLQKRAEMEKTIQFKTLYTFTTGNRKKEQRRSMLNEKNNKLINKNQLITDYPMLTILYVTVKAF